MVKDLDPPTLEELDALSPDKPFVILTQMTHDAYSAALRAAGIEEDTPNPPGGEFGRDADGKLNGTVHEVNALSRLTEAMPPLPDALAKLLLHMQYGQYARVGYTTIGMLGPVGRVEDQLGMMQELSSYDDVPLRVVVYGLPKHVDSGRWSVGDVNDRFRFQGVKFWMDGSPYTGGAAWDEPYEDTSLVRERLHLAPGHMASLNYEADAFTELYEKYHRAGYQIAVHVQGERTVRRVLDVTEDVLERFPRVDHRHRLEHNALISRGQIERAKSLGVELSFFIDHVYFYGDHLPELVGNRTDRYMPMASAFNAGHRATLHTDNPTTPIDPFRAVKPQCSASLGEVPRRWRKVNAFPSYKRCRQ